MLKNKNNRLVWGGMIGLSTIAPLKSAELYANLKLIIEIIDKGTIITMDAGIKTLVGIATQNSKYCKKIFSELEVFFFKKNRL